MDTILRNSPVPRYHQLKEILREKVRVGEWRPGQVIPSERELCEQYGISRMTVRQALTELVNEGLFYRERGLGTFVMQQKITQQLVQLTSFTEDIRARGQRPGAKVLAASIVPVDDQAAQHLRIQPGQSVFRLHRLRLADSEPLAIELSMIYFAGCERLLQEDFEHQSLYHLLETKYAFPLIISEQELEATPATAEQAQILTIPVGSPVLATRRTTYTERDQPIEYVRSVFRGNKYVFYTRMRREQYTL